MFKLIVYPERLQKHWRSAVYGFFKATVDIGYEDGHKFHQFQCAASKCKGNGKVRHYQDSKDCAATSNLKSHAIKCFGQDAVEAAFNKTDPPSQDGSIFAAFAHQGQQPVTVSHRAHTTDETLYIFQYNILKIFLSNNRAHIA